MGVEFQAANQDFNLYGKVVKVDQLLDTVDDRAFSQNYTTNPWITGWETSDIAVTFNSTTLVLMLYMPYRIQQGGTGSLAFVEVQYSQDAGATWIKAGRSSFMGDYRSGVRDSYFHQLHIPGLSAGTIRFRLAHAVYVLGSPPTVFVNPTDGGMTSAFRTQFVAMQYASIAPGGSVNRKIAELPRGIEPVLQEAGCAQGEIIFSDNATITFPNLTKLAGTATLTLLRIPAGLVTVLGPTASTRMLTANVSVSIDNGLNYIAIGSTAKYGTSGGVNDQMAKYTHFIIPVVLATLPDVQLKFKVVLVADTTTTSGFYVNKGLTNASPLRASLTMLEFTQ